MPEISLAIAFGSGLLTFFSACLIPVVPAYISYISGVSLAELNKVKNSNKNEYKKFKKRIIFNSIFFILGFSLVFVLLGLTATSIGLFLNQKRYYLMKGGGAFMILLGIYLSGIVKLPFLYKSYSVKTKKINAPLYTNSFLLGFAFGLSWTPCISPILSGILFMASLSQTIWQGGVLLTVFALGLAIPFFIIALTIATSIKILPKISKYSNVLKYVASVVIIFIGILMLTGKWDKLIAGLIN